MTGGQVTPLAEGGSQINLISPDIKPNWWNRRTKLERGLLVLTFILILIFTIIIIALAILWASKNTYKVCLTEACVTTASNFILQMDDSVPPCENFYKFACGRYIKSTHIPEDRSQVGLFEQLEKLMNENLRAMLEELTPQNKSDSLSLLSNFYNSCMNTTQIEILGLDPLKEIFNHLGGWPVLDQSGNWTGDNFTWIDAIYRLHEHGYDNYFFSVELLPDKKNSSYMRLGLVPPSFGCPFLSHGRTFETFAYEEYQVNLAVLHGANWRQATEEMMAILLFETELAQEAQSPPEDVTMTISQLEESYPSIPWVNYINTLMPPELPLDRNDTIVVNNPNFMLKLEQLINQTSKRVQANYVSWRVAKTSAQFLNEASRRLHLKYGAALGGPTVEPRWSECVSTVNNKLPWLISSHYIRHHFDPKTKQSVQEMVNNIRAAFLNILNELDWMDSTTRRRAEEKVWAMAHHVGYPDELFDDVKLTEFLIGLEMAGDSYFGNILNWMRFARKQSFAGIKQKVNKTDWLNHAMVTMVNAFYMPSENSMQIPAGILQGLFFHPNRPNYVNYGSIGWIIGHELTHGFDNNGAEYDADGNLAEWWLPETKKLYQEKATCMVHQYGNFNMIEIDERINGELTLGENIADNGGVKESYRAYVDWTGRNGEEERLPGLNFSPRQLFWISAATVWCGKYTRDGLRSTILIDEHSPMEFRVMGTFANVREFALDFNCPPGSGMNPLQKCSVW